MFLLYPCNTWASYICCILHLPCKNIVAVTQTSVLISIDLWYPLCYRVMGNAWYGKYCSSHVTVRCLRSNLFCWEEIQQSRCCIYCLSQTTIHGWSQGNTFLAFQNTCQNVQYLTFFCSHSISLITGPKASARDVTDFSEVWRAMKCSDLLYW